MSAADPQMKGAEYTSELGFGNTGRVFLVTCAQVGHGLYNHTLQRLHNLSKNLGFLVNKNMMEF